MGNKYRAQATELLELAQRASDPELATIYRQLAFQYERLAGWMECRHDFSEPWESSSGLAARYH